MCTASIIPALVVGTMATSTLMGAKVQQNAGNAQAAVIQQNASNNAKVAEYNATAVENAANYNATVLENNASLYREAATDAIARGAEDAGKERQAARQATGTARANRASSGTMVDEGINLDLQAQNAATGEMNALTVLNNSEREAYGYTIQETNALNEAENIRYQAKLNAGGIRYGAQVGVNNANFEAANSRYAGKLNSTSTLISGASNIASFGSNYYRGGF